MYVNKSRVVFLLTIVIFIIYWTITITGKINGTFSLLILARAIFTLFAFIGSIKYFELATNAYTDFSNKKNTKKAIFLFFLSVICLIALFVP